MVSRPVHYAGSMHAIPACTSRGVYTMHMNGANHTPKISQSHIASLVSAGIQTQINARAMNARYFPSLTTNSREGDAKVNVRPRITARAAAREKLSTVVMEMTVDARQRFRALNISDVEPSLWDASVAGITACKASGNNDRSVHDIEVSSWDESLLGINVPRGVNIDFVPWILQGTNLSRHKRVFRP
jgi:hypothetical protein